MLFEIQDKVNNKIIPMIFNHTHEAREYLRNGGYKAIFAEAVQNGQFEYDVEEDTKWAVRRLPKLTLVKIVVKK